MKIFEKVDEFFREYGGIPAFIITAYIFTFILGFGACGKFR